LEIGILLPAERRIDPVQTVVNLKLIIGPAKIGDDLQRAGAGIVAGITRCVPSCRLISGAEPIAPNIRDPTAGVTVSPRAGGIELVNDIGRGLGLAGKPTHRDCQPHQQAR
jgi:hypothetical protein